MEVELRGLGKKLDTVCEQADNSRERVLKLEQAMPEKHLAVHEQIENKLVEHQGKWQNIANYVSVAINTAIAYFVSQGLK